MGLDRHDRMAPHRPRVRVAAQGNYSAHPARALRRGRGTQGRGGVPGLFCLRQHDRRGFADRRRVLDSLTRARAASARTAPGDAVMAAPEMFNLDGRVAVVTGGNGGIGSGIALGLAEAGAAVAVLARNEEKNEAVLGELRALNPASIALKLDVTDR